MLLVRGLQFKEREKDSRELESITINTRLSITVVLKFMRGIRHISVFLCTIVDG